MAGVNFDGSASPRFQKNELNRPIVCLLEERLMSVRLSRRTAMSHRRYMSFFTFMGRGTGMRVRALAALRAREARLYVAARVRAVPQIAQLTRRATGVTQGNSGRC